MAHIRKHAGGSAEGRNRLERVQLLGLPLAVVHRRLHPVSLDCIGGIC